MNKLLKSIGTGILKSNYATNQYDEWQQLLEEIKKIRSPSIERLCKPSILASEHVDDYRKLRIF
jgi:hypothetical protein